MRYEKKSEEYQGDEEKLVLIEEVREQNRQNSREQVGQLASNFGLDVKPSLKYFQ